MLGSDEDQTFFIMTNDDNDYPYNFVFVKCFDLLTDCQLIGSPGCCWYFVFGHLVMAEEAPPAKCIMAEEGPPAKRTRLENFTSQVLDFKDWSRKDGETLLEDEDSQVWVPSEDLHLWKAVPEDARRELRIGEFAETKTRTAVVITEEAGGEVWSETCWS